MTLKAKFLATIIAFALISSGFTAWNFATPINNEVDVASGLEEPKPDIFN